MKSTKFWIIVTVMLLALSGGAAVLMHSLMSGGSTARIYFEGECIEEIDLSKVAQPYSFTIEGKTYENTVLVERGRICVSESTCPDKVCVRQGFISNGAVPVVCLPNKLVIRVENEEDPEVDGVAG